jgi:hypothetical protein
MAIDELMEQHRWTKTRAKKHLANMVWMAQKARHLAEAARELRPDGVWHDDLLELVRSCCGLAHNNAFTICLVEGSAGPVPTRSTEYHVGVFVSTICVTVSASWVIDAVAGFWWQMMEYAQLNSADETARLLANRKPF